VLVKTKGIVFRYVKYGESSIIVTIFTCDFGLQSYIINGVRGNSRTNKIALYQPLTLLDLVAYHKEAGGIMRIKEAKCIHPYHSLNTDIRKSAIAIFINELLNKTVKEQSHTESIFEYIESSLVSLDENDLNENFHLFFLIGLSKHLGFGSDYINEIIGSNIVTDDESNVLRVLIHSDLETRLSINYQQRQNLLSVLLKFYSRHIDNFANIKSIEVLKEVLN
jgi:DNA repair protein RecO (recombination protein O)